MSLELFGKHCTAYARKHQSQRRLSIKASLIAPYPMSTPSMIALLGLHNICLAELRRLCWDFSQEIRVNDVYNASIVWIEIVQVAVTEGKPATPKSPDTFTRDRLHAEDH
jgi:hypothetical protein